MLHFFSIDTIKAGFLVKKQGVWYITEEGEAALKLEPVSLLDAATSAYDKWREQNPKQQQLQTDNETQNETIVEDGEQAQEATLQQMEQLAYDGLASQLEKMNGYEMQDFVAGLLRGMGYFTPFVAPKGKDGGLDVIAYQDPLGINAPRIRVQIKHRQGTTSVKEIRELIGLLNKENDVGIFVSTGGFTSDAKTTVRHASVHIELIDLDKLLALWQEFYFKCTDEDKNRLRLKPVYFYDPQL
jgi:restriction system protein